MKGSKEVDKSWREEEEAREIRLSEISYTVVILCWATGLIISVIAYLV